MTRPMTMLEAYDFATLCVHAFWRLEKTDEMMRAKADVASIDDLWHWCLDIADGTDQSECALRIYAEAVAGRLEGK